MMLRLLPLALTFFALQSAMAETPVPIRKSTPMADGGRFLGTTGYGPLEDESPFLKKITEKPIDLWANIKLPKAVNLSDEDWKKIQDAEAERKKNRIAVDEFELENQVGEYVGWFGIVRSRAYDANLDQTRVRVEHKYFDGLTDLHLQIVSIFGAGDFDFVIKGKVQAQEIPLLSLLRVYGQVSKSDDGVVLASPEYVRVWDWGLFTFMDYGKDKSNPAWVQLRKVAGSDAYSPRVTEQFYIERLGPRKNVEP